MGNWERFGAFNQDHQSSPVYKSQRQAWNQDRGSGQNFQPRGKEKYLFIRAAESEAAGVQEKKDISLNNTWL